MIETTYADLAKEIHETARDKGFWDEERDLEEMLMLAISELSEGMEEHREGKPVLYHVHDKNCTMPGRAGTRVSYRNVCDYCTAKPEGLAVELADCIIRCLDMLQHYAGVELMGYMAGAYSRFYKTDMPAKRSSQLFRVTRVLANASPREFLEPYLAQAIVLADWMLSDLGADTFETIRLKMDYNKTRERMHGKAY